MKRFLSILLALTLSLALLPLPASAVEASGTCGAEGNEAGVTWTLTADGTLTISGTGAMADFSIAGAPWKAKKESITSVVVESGVTTIGWSSFSGCTNLTSVTLPDGLTTIEAAAFERCTSLTDIALPDSVTAIEIHAFVNCTNLTDITLPNCLTRIGAYAFQGCKSLTAITIPDNVTDIIAGPFSACSNLTSITVSAGNQTFAAQDGVLFNKKYRELVQFPAGNSIATYTVPEDVAAIGSGAFWRCTNLTSITLPDNLNTIGNDAFVYCINLADVEIPASLTYLGQRAFQDCTSLTDIYYSGSETQWNAVLISDNSTPLTSATIHYNYYRVTDGQKLTGTLGENEKLDWTYDAGVLEIARPIKEKQMVLVGVYNEAGQLTDAKFIDTQEASAQLGNPAQFKLFWIDSGLAPQCAAVTVEN